MLHSLVQVKSVLLAREGCWLSLKLTVTLPWAKALCYGAGAGGGETKYSLTTPPRSYGEGRCSNWWHPSCPHHLALITDSTETSRVGDMGAATLLWAHQYSSPAAQNMGRQYRTLHQLLCPDLPCRAEAGAEQVPLPSFHDHLVEFFCSTLLGRDLITLTGC